MANTNTDLAARINALTQQIDAGAAEMELSHFYYDRAGLFGLLDERAKAIKDYGEALTLAENSYPLDKKYIAEIRSMMGLELILQGKKESAIFWALCAIDKDQHNALIYFNFGLICSHSECEMFHIAIEAFRKTVELQPDNGPATLKLGECLREVYRIPESIEVLSKYVANQPHDPRGFYELGKTTQLALSVKDRIDRAKEFYQRALQLNPSPELRGLIELAIRDADAEP